MSLYERAQKTKNPNLTKGQIAVAFMNSKKERRQSTLSVLHKEVQKIISPEKLAEIMSSNPQRAQAEIRNAAYHCFNKPN